MDYRDTLHALVENLRHTEGLTWYQLAQRGRINEQILAGVLRKDRNLSPQSLGRFLEGFGYRINFEKVALEGPSPSIAHKK